MGQGGARYGAGRPAYRAKGEQLQRVDVRIWARQGYLSRARAFSWTWNRGGEPTGSIGVTVHPQSAVNLAYTVTNHNITQQINDRVALIYKPCNFGGARPWFQCPRCARQVAQLYMRAGRFACRHCQRVAYSSQAEDVLDRTWRKQQRLEAKLGEYWQRPKGMRLSTYERLRDALWQCEKIRDEAMLSAITRLFGHRLKGGFSI
jgi:hypothetical protein